MSIFPLIPNADISETWEWKTDVMTTINGTESRLSLYPEPRITLEAEFGPFTAADRRKAFNTLQLLMKDVYTTPIWPYCSPISQETTAGNDRVYFNPAMVPVAVDGRIALINPVTGYAEAHVVDTVHSDGATLATNVTANITTTFIACLAMQAYLEDGARINTGPAASIAALTFRSTVEPAVERPGTAASAVTFDSLPVLDRLFIDDAEENFEFPRELIDFGGVRQLQGQEKFARVIGQRKFIADRILSLTDFDYWRLFLNTTKGAWKPFLISTQLSDFSLFTGLTQNGSTITVNEASIETPDNAFSRIEIIYGDLSKSRHVLSGRVDNGNDTYTYTVTPNIPNDPKVSSVRRVSYLLKVRMGDTVQFQHGHLRSLISFEVRTTDQG